MKKFLLTFILAVSALFTADAKVVLTEDFSLFTNGSDTAPDYNNMMTDLTGLTQTAGWSGMNVCQAGGSAYLPAGAYLATPALDLSANNGSFVVTFKAKSDSYPAMVIMSDMYMASMGYVEITNEWKEYSITLNNGAPNYMIAIQALYSDFYIDDIVVDDNGVDIPFALPSSNFTKNSFTANWMAVNGATSYLLDVYTYNYNYETTTFDPVFLLKDKEVTGTSYVVTEGEFDVPYYYNVAAKGGSSISDKSQRVTVFPSSDEVSAPVAYDAENIGEDKFTASWSASDIATKYYLQVVKIHTADHSEDYVIADYDFSEFTEGTLESPHKEMEYLFEGDWSASMALMADGAIGINNEDINFFGAGILTSPVIALNGADRKFNVSLKAVARDGMKRGTLQLCTIDKEYNVTICNSKEIALTEEWAEYSFELNGTAGVASTLVITSDEAGRMFIDDLKVSVKMNKGEVLPVPVRTYASRELSHDVSELGAASDDRICYNVTASWAVRQQEGVVIQIPEVRSAASNVVYVNMPTSIGSVEAVASAKVSVKGNTIMVSNPACENIAIYTASGKQVVYATDAPAGAQFVMPVSGVYVVTVGAEEFKVSVQN